MTVAIDHQGQEITDMMGTPVLTNSDGTIDIYHRTAKKETFDAIVRTGRWKSLMSTRELYFSNQFNSASASGFGDYVIHARILPKYVEVNDQFRNGEVHLTVSVRDMERFGKIVKDNQTGLHPVAESVGPFEHMVERNCP